jgi:hypothetical protein
LDIWETATCSIKATVKQIEHREFTQLAMILDGSTSISDSNWDLMMDGLSGAILDEDIFPRDESVELTVVQFGGGFFSSPHADTEVEPTIITDSNYANIASIIFDLKDYGGQLGGYTPMGCGIGLAADKIMASSNFEVSGRQVFAIVSDGLPNCEWQSGVYTGALIGTHPDDYDEGKVHTENAREYLINTLQLDDSNDEIDALGVGIQSEDIEWFNSSIVWPNGYIAPPFNNGSGWVCHIETFNEFGSAINEMFNIIFNSILTPIKISRLTPSDPNIANDEVTVTIIPTES